MLKDFLTSVVIVPVLLGILALRGRSWEADRRILRMSWFAFAIIWFGALYYLRHKWA